MDIYWIEEKMRKGPATVPDIIARVQMGELKASTPAWHKGCAAWMPLRDLPAMADFRALFDAPLPTPDTEVKEEQEEDQIAGLLTPTDKDSYQRIQEEKAQLPPIPVQMVKTAPIFSRFLARMTDYSIYATIAMGILYLLKVPFNEFVLPSSPIFWLPALLIEAFLLSKYGNTPGKWMMGIRIQPLQHNTHRLSFPYALSRSFGVFIFGMGCFIHLLPIIMLTIAAINCNKGILSLWDRRANTLPISVPYKRPSIFTCIAIIFVAIQAVGFFMQPWMPAMIEQVRETAPWLLEYIPSEIPTNN